VVDRNVIAAELGGTVEPQASIRPLSLAVAGIWLVPQVGSTSGQVRGTQGTRFKIGICMQAHSHSLVMIVVIGRHDSSPWLIKKEGSSEEPLVANLKI